MWNLVAIAVGGALGAVCRYSLSNVIQRWFGSGFAWGTACVNLLGCFLIGLAVHLIFLQKLPHAVSFLVVVGFLGAFTTFSTFANENMEFLRDGAWGAAALYVLLSTVGGVALCFAGFLLGHQLHAVLK